MLRHPPKFQYNGLCIIMSNPSRFDTKQLLDGTGGYFFNQECLYPETNRYCCDIRLIDDPAPLLPNTKCILLMGQKALSKYTGVNTTLDEQRGSPIVLNGIPCIATFNAQDAMDIKNYERTHNDILIEEEEAFSSDETAAGELIESKGRGRTSRSNYRFWLKVDTKKALRILENNGQLPKLYEGTPNYIICPEPSVVVDILLHPKKEYLFFDMETDFTSIDIRCYAFSFSSKPLDVYIVPVLDINYKPYYGEETYKILRALSIAIRDNTLVAHNGSSFDFFVLAYKLQIPIGRSVYDSMVVAHRCYPEIEKSLGHWVSLCTYEPYHKNEGVHAYRTHEQARQLYLYCGKDVFTMYLIKQWQDAMAAKDEGLKASIEQANRMIKPYLTMTMLGIKFDEQARQDWIKESDKLMTQYMRIMRILTGPEVDPLISNKKCVKYFNEIMGYPVVKRTPKGGSSLAADALLKLKLQIDNPVADFLIKYREKQKETGTLNFKVWKSNDVKLPVV